MKILLTGSSGTWGREALKSLMKLGINDFKVVLPLRRKQRNQILSNHYKMLYGDKVDIVFSDLKNYADCIKLVDGVDYIFNLAAIIPPTADHYPKTAYQSNVKGTKNLVEAIKNSNKNIKFIHASSVSVYGGRNYKHPWGRVGDPVMPAAFDYYAMTKAMSERIVLESGLPNFVILRQTAILHKNLFANNLKDGLMFHTAWNSPLEWTTAHDSGRLIKNIVKLDDAGMLENFWNRIYNIGGGDNHRVTGYDTFKDGFALCGATVSEFFRPNWNATKNFHGVWFEDSNQLDEKVHFVSESYFDYWNQMKKHLWYYTLAKPIPKKWLAKFMIEPLLENTNAPTYWIKHGKNGRVKAFFGSYEKFCELPDNWSEFPLLVNGKSFDGKVVDYKELKNIKNAPKYRLYHGYDETKSDLELDIEDMKMAAKFRGGKCLSQTMEKGNLFQKLRWECHDGHEFEATPYTVLKAGHWCPECVENFVWRWSEIQKHSPFYKQLWVDTHKRGDKEVFENLSIEENFLFEE